MVRSPVLATCGIRPSDEAFENIQSRLLLLADFEEEEYNLKQSPAHLHKGVTYTVHGILTFIKRLTGLCLQSLHPRFVDWTKLDITSLIFGTVTDLARSRSELVAENALLRQHLIILRRQVKRPTCTKTDRLILVLLARASRAWKQALLIVQEDDAPAVAAPGIQALLDIHVQSSCSQTKELRRDRGLEEARWQAPIACGELNGSAANCSSWVLASANARSRSR